MAPSPADRSALATLSTPLSCLGYAVLAATCMLTLRSLPAPWSAVPVLLAASFYGVRGALWVSALLALVSLALVAGVRGVAAVGSELPWLAPPALIGIALGLLCDRLRRTLARARRSGERHEIAVQGTGDGLFEWSLERQHMYYSDTFALLLGCVPGELGSSPDAWFSRVHAADLAGLRSDLEANLAGHSERFENEHRIRRKDGSWLWVRASGMAARDVRGKGQRIAGWLSDIHDQKRSEDQLRHHAFHDALTSLPNRALFMDRLAHALARARRSPSTRFALALLDLDRFKQVNDRLGHTAGDELLVAVSQRLESCLRPGDTVARLGGDEFMLLLEEVDGLDEARSVVERVQRALATPLPIGGHDVVASASIGLAMGGGSIVTPDVLLRDADTAMYEAKARGMGELVCFEPRMHDRALERQKLEGALRTAIDHGELQVHYQPIVDLVERRIIGFEALARWRHATLGFVSPLRFIPLAEETGLMAEIGAFVLTRATTEAERLQRLFHATPLSMHVNVSVRQLQQDGGLLDRVDRALSQSGLPPDRLTLEVTESVILQDVERGERLLSALRERGIRVCMDDFGTGYASLSYLHRFRVDSVKIDLSFVRGLTDPDGGAEIVKTILTLSRTLGIDAIAEGIETPAQLARLRALGCTKGQGFLFSAPVEAAGAKALLTHPLACP